jgi:hypothetical protein
MHDALQLLLLPTSIEQYPRSLNVCSAIKFRWHAGVIQMPDEMVDQPDTVGRLLYAHRVSDLAWNNRNRLSKLTTRLLHIASKDTHIRLVFDQFSYKG